MVLAFTVWIAHITCCCNGCNCCGGRKKSSGHIARTATTGVGVQQLPPVPLPPTLVVPLPPTVMLPVPSTASAIAAAIKSRKAMIARMIFHQGSWKGKSPYCPAKGGVGTTAVFTVSMSTCAYRRQSLCRVYGNYAINKQQVS